jgi:atypical dual specificity phosphatase
MNFLSWFGFHSLDSLDFEHSRSESTSSLLSLLILLQPFYSQITETIAIGSLPFSSDVEYLKSKNVCGVINLCYEYLGPVEHYCQHEIQQLHLPTLDVHEPTLEHMKQAITFIEIVLSPSAAEERRDEPSLLSRKNFSSARMGNDEDLEKKVVFIHCKGGRGRAVITCLCYLISKGFTLQESFQQIKSCRSVASEGVLYSTIVKEFERWIKLEQHNVRN